MPVEAQVIGMSEMYEALPNDRPFRKALSSAESIEVMMGLAEKRFAPELLEQFAGMVAE